MMNQTITADAIDALLDDESAAAAIRELLIFPDAPSNELIHYMIDDDNARPITDAFDAIDDLRSACTAIRADRELLTYAALALSLCPLHLHDYAICFDDDDAECAAIRTIHPSHDS